MAGTVGIPSAEAQILFFVFSKVWPAILVTLVVSGPILYFIIAVPNVWQPRFLVRSHGRLFFDCAWFTTTIILRQSEVVVRVVDVFILKVAFSWKRTQS